MRFESHTGEEVICAPNPIPTADNVLMECRDASNQPLNFGMGAIDVTTGCSGIRDF